MTTLVRRAIATAVTAGTVLALAPAVAHASGTVVFRGTVTGGWAWRHHRKSQNIQEQPKTGLEERGLDTAEPMAQADGWHTS